MRPPGTERARATAATILRERGYEPYAADDGSIRLRSCPFHDIARYAPQLVCGMNRAFIEGIVRGIGNLSLEAALEPMPGQCCVALRPRRQGDASPAPLGVPEKGSSDTDAERGV